MPALRSDHHLPALDGLRGLAVVLVLVHHLARDFTPDGAGEQLLYFAARYGWVGVDLFFVLSGFLITGILHDARGTEGYFRAFYARRALRIFPLYYAALALHPLAARLYATPEELAALRESLPWAGLYLTNVRLTLEGAWSAAPLNTAHFWSLAVEEQFYLLWPAVVAGVASRRRLMGVCVGLAAAAVAFRVAVHGGSPIGAYTLLPARMDGLAVGAFLALLARGGGGLERAARGSGPVLLGTGALLLLLSPPGHNSYEHPLQQTAGYTLWAVLFGALLVRALTAPRTGTLGRLLHHRVLGACGRHSYALYVLHFPVFLGLARAGLLERGFPAFAAAGLAVTFALAWASRRWLEAPFLTLKDRFPYRAPRPAPSAAPAAD